MCFMLPQQKQQLERASCLVRVVLLLELRVELVQLALQVLEVPVASHVEQELVAFLASASLV